MCGICGIVQDPPGPIDVGALESMAESMIHRGPDGYGYHVEAGVGLGHRRLSIIDLDGGCQPMFNRDQSLAVVFNGEIYNYKELQADLKLRGHTLATSSDTEVLIHLYEDFGPNLVDHLNGMFAFAIWDKRKRTLLIARDRLGEKPLYYYFHEGTLFFASELKALLRHPGVPRNVNSEVLDDYLTYGYVPGERCIITGVKKLAPGHRLIWNRGKLNIESYWDVRFDQNNNESDADRVEHLRHLMGESVRMRLRSDVPLGVFLSGGVDSSAVAAFAQEVSDRPIQTFSVGFEDGAFNELPIARQTAELLGTEHHEIMVTEAGADILPELAYHLDEPFADPSALPTSYICREARKHVTVCLSGDGGDELFAGYHRYRQAKAYARVDWIPQPIRRAVFGGISAAMPQYLWGRGFLSRLSASAAGRYLGQICTFTQAERAKLLAPGLGGGVQSRPWMLEPYFANGAPDLVARLQFADQKTYLPDDILVKVDRLSMSHSLEVRVPFLDHHVVEYVNSCPTSSKLRNGESKYLLKQIVRGRIPDKVLSGPKRGFGIPIRHWFRNGWANYAHDLLLSPSARLNQFMDSDAICNVVEVHSKGMRDFSKRIWALVIFEHWCRACSL